MKQWGISVLAIILLAQASYAADREPDFLDAKLAVDRQIDPIQNEKWERREIDNLVKAVLDLAGRNADARNKITALRTVIYQAGPWNDNRPFDYNHDEAEFKSVRVALLSNYLKTRLGNCTSMPILFLILADRLGLIVELSRAPHHLLVHYTDPEGNTYNVEPTSGARAQKVGWIRFLMPMTDDAVNNGVYLSDLTHEQTIAEMKDTLIQRDMEQNRYSDAVSLSDELVNADPRNAVAVARRGLAYLYLIKAEFEDKYMSPRLYPADVWPRYMDLMDHYRADKASAYNLGYRTDVELPLNMDGWKLPVEEIKRRCPACSDPWPSTSRSKNSSRQ